MAAGRPAYLLDGDNLRHGLNADLGFGETDRTENVRRVGEVAQLFADAGTVSVVALISPYRGARDRVRQRHPEVLLRPENGDAAAMADVVIAAVALDGVGHGTVSDRR